MRLAFTTIEFLSCCDTRIHTASADVLQMSAHQPRSEKRNNWKVLLTRMKRVWHDLTCSEDRSFVFRILSFHEAMSYHYQNHLLQGSQGNLS